MKSDFTFADWNVGVSWHRGVDSLETLLNQVHELLSVLSV